MTDEQTTETPEQTEKETMTAVRLVAECPKHGVLADNTAIPSMQIHGVAIDMPCPKCLNAALKKLGVHRVRYKAVSQ